MTGKPTEVLEQEHHVIQQMVGVMATFLARLEKGENLNADSIKNIVEFMRTFGDRCHHGKEEIYLFPLLGKKGVPMTGCPLAILIHEHEKGRSLVKQLSEAGMAYAKGDEAATSELIKSLRGLTDLYPNHIWKEEYLLFPMTNKVLSDEDQKELSEKFEMVEQDIGADVHEHFEKMVKELVSEI